MPNIDQMFPSKYISYKDLDKNVPYSGTIAAVSLEAARAQGWSAGGRNSQPVEQDWVIVFREWGKPFKLKPAKAQLLAQMFGSKNTDDWVGRVVNFYRSTIVIGQEAKECISIDDRPQMPSQAPGLVVSAQSSTGVPPPRKPMFLDPARAKVKIPDAAITRFKNAIADYEKTWSDFVAWLKQQNQEAHDLVVGRALDDISGAVLPAMGLYVELLSKPAKAPAPAPSTAKPGYEPIQEEDIPF